MSGFPPGMTDLPAHGAEEFFVGFGIFGSDVPVAHGDAGLR